MLFNKAVLKEFVTESKEHLESIEQELLAIDEGKTKQTEESIGNIFRCFHNIKGNSGFFNLTSIKELAHKSETLLSYIRSGKIVMKENIIDVLLKAIDVLNSLIENLDESNNFDISEILYDLNITIEKEINEPGMDKNKTQIEILDPNNKSIILKVDDINLDLIPKNHEYLYYLKFNITDLIKGKKISPVNLVKKLTSLGEIIKGIVRTPFKDLHEGLPEDKFYYAVIFSTVLEPLLIQEAVYLEPENIKQINKEDLIKEKPEEIITDEILENFITESNEYIDNIEKILVELEKNPNNRKIALEEIFRLIHSLKGNAGFFEFNSLEEQCMDIESIIESMNKTGKAIDKDQISTFYNKFDTLRNTINMVTKDGESKEYAIKDERKPLGEVLLDLGKISEEELNNALEIQKNQTWGIFENENVKKPELINKENQSSFSEKSPSVSIRKNDIRVNTQKLDKLFDYMGELVTAETMICSHPDLKNIKSESLAKSINYLSKITKSMQEITLSIRMVPLEGLFNKMYRVVRDLSKKSQKQLKLEIYGSETEMDRNVIEIIADPLIHIIRNSADHGIEDNKTRKKLDKPETGTIKLSAKIEGSEIWISVEDDGSGLKRELILEKARKNKLISDSGEEMKDEEVWQLIFFPGFSTARTVTEVSGRGVGMDVVKSNIEKCHGKIDVSSKKDQGTKFILKIPLTLAIVDGVHVAIGNSNFAIPIADVLEFHKTENGKATMMQGNKKVLNIRSELIPIINMRKLLKISSNGKKNNDEIMIVCKNSHGKKAGLLVDEVISYQQIVKKALPGLIGSKKGISGCSIMGNGRINLILDINQIISKEFL